MKEKDPLRSLWMCYPSDVCFCVRYSSGVVIAGNGVVACQVRWVPVFFSFGIWHISVLIPVAGNGRIFTESERRL